MPFHGTCEHPKDPAGCDKSFLLQGTCYMMRMHGHYLIDALRTGTFIGKGTNGGYFYSRGEAKVRMIGSRVISTELVLKDYN